MKKKLLLGLIILIILAGVTLFLLDYLEVFTFEELKKLSMDKAQEIPVVAEYLVSKDQNENLNNKVDELKEELAQLKLKNEDLTEELKAKEIKIVTQKQDLKQLQEDIVALQVDQQNYQDKVKRLSDIYSEMDPSSSAVILAKLEARLTIDILEQIDEETVAEILTIMDSNMAADISTELSY